MSVAWMRSSERSLKAEIEDGTRWTFSSVRRAVTTMRVDGGATANDLLMQMRMQREGRYQRPDDFTID